MKIFLIIGNIIILFSCVPPVNESPSAADIVYENIEDCLKKIDLYLEDEYTRGEIGEGIYNQIRKLHTSRKRAKEIIRDFTK